jgi:hypothetical protein
MSILKDNLKIFTRHERSFKCMPAKIVLIKMK